MGAPTVDIDTVVAAIAARCVDGSRPLVAVSGIDGSGKSTIAPKIVLALQARGIATTLVALDPWHTAPEVRFDPRSPAETFYRNAYRWNDLFERLLLPLQRDRRIELTIELRHAATNEPYRQTYRHECVRAIVVEGIFLLKRELRAHYDLAYWVECPFETALARALLRNQEGLAAEALVRDYETTYFPAQRLHLQIDDPLASADGVLWNG